MAWVETVLTQIEAARGWDHLPVSICDTAVETDNRIYLGHNYHSTATVREQFSMSTHTAKSVRNSGLLRAVSALARGAPITCANIVERLSGHFEVGEVRDVVAQLLSIGYLHYSRGLSPTGDVAAFVTRRLQEAGLDGHSATSGILQDLNHLGQVPPFDPLAFEQATVQLRAVAPAVSTPLQVDMRRDLSGQLPQRVFDDVSAYCRVLQRSPAQMNVSAFYRALYGRFDSETRLVAVKELLDSALGIGLPGPAGVARTAPAGPGTQDLLRLVLDAERESKSHIEIDGPLFDRLFPLRAGVAWDNSYDIGFQLWAEQIEDIEAGDYLIAPAAFAGINGAGRLMGRFLHMFVEEEGANIYRAIAKDMANATEETLEAELVYWPSVARSANVLLRPRIVNCEIQVGFNDPGPGVTRLSLDKLYVGLEAGRPFLWSSEYHKKVLVRESHMHNAAAAPGIARFFSALAQIRSGIPVGFTFPSLDAFPHVPRIIHERFVLTPERWLLDASKLRAKDGRDYLRQFVRRFLVPKEVMFLRGDNRILLDLERSLSFDILSDELSQTSAPFCVFQETGLGKTTWLSGDGGTYASEFVISASPLNEKTATNISASAGDNQTPASNLQAAVESIGTANTAAWHVGDAWLYVKLYTGATNIDAVLDFLVRPLIERLLEGSIDRWFFIRYSDPNSHIRLRIHCRDGVDPDSITARIATDLRNACREKTIYRFAFDTYFPEAERYGGQFGIALAEEIFCADSMEILHALRGTPKSMEQKITACLAIAAFVFRPFFDRGSEIIMAGKRRQTKEDRESVRRAAELSKMLLSARGGSPAENAIGELVDLATRSNHSVDAIVSSLIHMHCNRFGLAVEAERLLRFRFSKLCQIWKFAK